MSRRLIAAIATALAVILGVTVPALAARGHRSTHTRGHRSTHTRGHRGTHHSRRQLVLTRRFGSPTASAAQIGSADPSATLVYEGFRCEATVGIGADGQTAHNYYTNDSHEFYIAYTQAGTPLESVTTNCAGKLPAGTVHSTSIVSHTVACRQYEPGNESATIQGYGISTTYPDGLYSETCNTPNYS